MAQSNGQRDDDLAWLILAIFGILAAGAVWKSKVRPWIDDTFTTLSNGGSITIAGMQWDVTDLVGLGILVAVLVAVFFVVRGKVRIARAKAERRKREKEREREERGW